jgi:hypothetical protein
MALPISNLSRVPEIWSPYIRSFDGTHSFEAMPGNGVAGNANAWRGLGIQAPVTGVASVVLGDQ